MSHDAATQRFYDDTLAWVLDGFAACARRPFVVGVNGPQGAGKSTLCAALTDALNARGLRAATLSIDDVYLTRDEQQRLTDAHPTNPYLAARGYPGTHDLAIAARTLDALRSGASGALPVVGYDKGAHGGLGDRLDERRWTVITTPLDVLLFEGWMLGFEAIDEGELPDPAMAPCNAALRAYTPWRDVLDAFLHLDMQDDRYVLDWRVEAERARRAREGRGLSDAEALAYVERFLPAYAAWSPGLRANPPSPRARRVPLGRDRLPR